MIVAFKITADNWTETVECPLIARQHEHEQHAGYFKDFF